MARTLFFIEAALFTALGIGGVLVAQDLRPAFYAPFAISLVVPLACALAIWPFRDVAGALRRVFSSSGTAIGAEETIPVLETMGAFCGRAAVAGLAFSLSASLPRILAGEATESWSLLGAYLALYSLLNAVASSSMAKAAARIPARAATESAEAAEEEGSAALLASAYGLTPRESEVAALIAGGSSYKETAYELGISIRTVKTHITHAYEKTGCRSNVELALLPAFRSRGEDESSPHTKSR